MIKNLRLAAKLHLIVLLVLLVLVPVLAFTYNYFRKQQYTEVSVNSFKKKILENKVSTFVNVDTRMELTFTNTKAKYVAIASSLAEVDAVRNFTLFTPQGKPRNISNIESVPPFKQYFITNYSKVLLLFLLATMPFLWCMAMVDLFNSKFMNTQNKQIWFLGILLVPLIGPFCYAFMAEKQKKYIRLI